MPRRAGVRSPCARHGGRLRTRTSGRRGWRARPTRSSAARNTHEIAVSSAADETAERGQARRVGREVVGRGAGDVLQEEPEAGEEHDRQRQPVAERQRDGVHAEVVAQLVGEHAGQLAAASGLDRERRDDDEVPATRERVELVDGRIRTTKSSGCRSLRAASEVHTGPMMSSSRGSGRRAPSNGVSTATCTGRTNSNAPSASHVAGTTQIGTSQTNPQRKPQDHHRDQPEREQGGDRQERGDGRALQLTTPTAHPKHATAQDTEPRHTRQMTRRR